MIKKTKNTFIVFCDTCGKEVRNYYTLDNKQYGYHCYKQALSLKYIKLEQQKNNNYNCKCIALIETFKNKSFKNKWDNDFKESILNQWNTYNKLSFKQLELIEKKFNKSEYINYLLLYFSLLNNNKENEDIKKNIAYWIKREVEQNKFIETYKDNEIFKESLIYSIYSKEIYIITWYDVDDKEIIYTIVDSLNIIKVDEYTIINEVIKVK